MKCSTVTLSLTKFFIPLVVVKCIEFIKHSISASTYLSVFFLNCMDSEAVNTDHLTHTTGILFCVYLEQDPMQISMQSSKSVPLDRSPNYLHRIQPIGLSWVTMPEAN